MTKGILSMKLKVAVIGCGVIAPTHIESYQFDRNTEVALLCDIIPERAESLAVKYNINRGCSDAEEVFKDKSISAVSICTPHDSHAELCLRALAAGKDVICEKPISNTITGLTLLKRASRDYPDRIFAGIFQHRYNPVFKLMRELVAEGAFGTLLTAAVHNRCLRTAEYYNSDAWRGTKKYERGGVLINQAIHYLDLFQWIMGGVSEVKSFSANRTHQGIIETEDTIVGSVLFKNGALGTVEATNSAILDWDTQLQITGSKGFVSIVDGSVKEARFTDETVQKRIDAATDELNVSLASNIGKSYYGCGHPTQIADFINCVRTRGRPFVSAEDAIPAAKLVLAMYRNSIHNA